MLLARERLSTRWSKYPFCRRRVYMHGVQCHAMLTCYEFAPDACKAVQHMTK